MTQEELDLFSQLDKMLDPVAAKERGIQREFGRSPLINFTATLYIDPDVPTVDVVQNPTGNSWTERHLAVHLKDCEVTAHGNYGYEEQDEWLITMKVPDAGFDAREDDEAVLWFAGLQALIPGVSIGNLSGKRVTFEEQHKQYTYKRKKNNYVPEEGTRWWYQAVAVQGQKAAAPKVEATPETHELALAIIREAGEAGIPDKDFQLAATKVQSLKPLWADMLSGKWQAGQIKAGKVVVDPESSNLVVAE